MVDSLQAERQRVRHVLVIEDTQGRRTVSLEAATYSLGRDPSCAIVLNSGFVSRQHAILLRVPVTGASQVMFRIIDGNTKGERSKNGILVNGTKVSSHDLKHADAVSFSQDATVTYYTTTNLTDAEFAQYTEVAAFRSLKSEPEDPYQTTLQ